MAGAERKNFSQPDEARTVGHAKIEFIRIGGGVIRRITLQPGWRWSLDAGPAFGTTWCEASHFQYHVSGHLHVLLEDGTEFDLGPGDVSKLPGGHDTWVIGQEPVVLVDWREAIPRSPRREGLPTRQK
jgi:hypothetical protein